MKVDGGYSMMPSHLGRIKWQTTTGSEETDRLRKM